ncbi:MAG: nucleotidyltransferase family protein [Candidatus Sericytochromatia bacterium]|nr:nucleotidyltransferase family protein [Candidatus Sericytochromatia bacterium]
MNPEHLAVILTAAGRSTRMRELKPLLDWRGAPLIAHQVHTLSPCRKLLVVLGYAADIIGPIVPKLGNVQRVLNPHFDAGRASSIALAARSVPEDAEGILLVAVDQPARWEVVEALCRGISEGAEVALPCFEGKRGHPVLLRRSLLPSLRDLESQPVGLRSLLDARGDRVDEIRVDFPDVRWNLNTPADYERVR